MTSKLILTCLNGNNNMEAYNIRAERLLILGHGKGENVIWG
jgi:hypothetical protein